MFNPLASTGRTMKYGGWFKCFDDNLEPGKDESGLSRLYRKLWQRWPGRPLTYAIRDWWHQYPLLWILVPGSLLVYLGIFLGHLFW